MGVVEITAAAALSAYGYYNFYIQATQKKLNNPKRGDGRQQQYTETEQNKLV
jgi:hypothetical protein